VAKQLLITTTPLQFPDPAATIALATNASDSQAGAVLQQSASSGWQPLGPFPAKLTPAQQHDSTYDRELIIAYLAIYHFSNSTCIFSSSLLPCTTNHPNLLPTKSTVLFLRILTDIHHAPRNIIANALFLQLFSPLHCLLILPTSSVADPDDF
jgi:RNase H-like domain found in reverse transcriptase